METLKIKNTSDININIEEGKLLISAISIIASKTNENPMEIFKNVLKLANEIYN